MPRVVMTFREFQATQKRETIREYEARNRTDLYEDEATHVLSYGPGNGLFILEYPDEADFPFSLTLERDYWDGYDLEQLERRLYEWALQTGFCDIDMPEGAA